MFKPLFEISKKSVEKNIVMTAAGPLVTAGSHQFKTLWTRDFCYSVPGLLTIGRSDVVENQLNLILLNLRDEDSLIPRGIDVYPPLLRVFLQTVFRWIPGRANWLPYGNKDLKPEYLGEHRTIAFDSNLLTLLASAQYGAVNKSWFESQVPTFKKIFKMYDKYWSGDFLDQPAFSDWQDSSERKGITLYSQLLYLQVLRLFAALGAPLREINFTAAFQAKIHAAFYDSENGLYRNRINEKQFSLETQLWIIEGDLFKDFLPAATLYGNLKQHPLWNSFTIPGTPIFPRYAPAEVSWTTKLVGLKGYHDSFVWSWLIGESAKVARKMGDTKTFEHILSHIQNKASADQWIYEIYQPLSNGDFRIYRTPVYESESPFTWGAAKILEAIGAES
jgi:hypothetical protein